jgi:uncharacterized protein YndB with AHSA1/START domain
MAASTEIRRATAPVAPVPDDELFLVRFFDAPPSLVFRLWEDAAHRARWWGPSGHGCSHFTHEFREGGAWRACITSAEHGDSWQGGVYREIDRDRRIVFTFVWDKGPSAGVEMLVSVTLAAQGSGTIQTFHQTGFANVDRRNVHVVGWSLLFDSELAYLSHLPKEQRP